MSGAVLQHYETLRKWTCVQYDEKCTRVASGQNNDCIHIPKAAIDL